MTLKAPNTLGEFCTAIEDAAPIFRLTKIFS